MWDHYLFNKVKDLDNMYRSIRSLLRLNTIELLPHERRLFYITKTSIFEHTPKFRREWQVKANIIYQTHLKRLTNPISHRNERLAMQQWLKVVPRPTRVTPQTLPTQQKIFNK